MNDIEITDFLERFEQRWLEIMLYEVQKLGGIKRAQLFEKEWNLFSPREKVRLILYWTNLPHGKKELELDS